MSGLKTLLLFIFGNFKCLYVNGKEDLNCSTETRCNCTLYKTYIIADCSRLSLKTTPNFTENVARIDLGLNQIREFPTNLPQHLTHLNLTGNSPLNEIKKGDLNRYKHLQHFVVSYCSLRRIEKGAFSTNKNLEYLDISNNLKLTLSVLKNVTVDLQSSKIKILLFDRLQCTYGVTIAFYTVYIKHLSNTTLQKLSVASNRISYFEHTMFRFLPNTLKEINVGDNDLSFGFYLFTLSSLKGIQIINATFQNSFHLKRNIKDVCHEPLISINEGTIFEEESAVYSENLFSPFAKREKRVYYLIFYIPPNLEKFYFHDNTYKLEIHHYEFNTTNGSRKLTHLYLQNNIFYNLIGPIKGLEGVQYIDLSNNLCAEISTQFFKEFVGLVQLNLSKNMLSSCIENDLEGDIFNRLERLEVLDLSFNRIRNLPHLIFKNMGKLTNLSLMCNGLETFNIAIDHMLNLSFVDLSNNMIAHFDLTMQTSIQSIIKNTRININILNNPLQCTCKDLDFMKWLQIYNDYFLHFTRYRCVSTNSSILSFQNFERIILSMESFCATYVTLIVILTLLMLIFLSITIAGLLSRYRWRLRYLYYLVKRHHSEKIQARKTDTYRYDAFVSYAEEDKDFILQKIDFLEDENNLSLCLHSRDFIPGTDIADNIANAIHNSRRTLCVLSSHFFDSYWCMYELNMARMESIYSRKRRDILCLVIRNKTVLKNMPLKVVDLFESQTYLEYSEYENNDTPFWNKICRTLQSPLQE